MKKRISGITIVLLAFISCHNSRDNIKFQQYFVKGEALYAEHCSNCHGKDGKGLGRLYPPLQDADYVAIHQDSIPCIIKYGMEGEVVVNGIVYNMPMPGIPTLSDLEIAEITTYVINKWDMKRELISVKDISSTIDSCGQNRIP